ncbi:MAG: bifunctional DNA-binding transcriptional regulator/O6-methylguanine-DNA methyltransferase Ada [Chloroflexi bacterium]|nr:bifunctional DNA-binding transcriptional regulator/O6-methylguanine-DNA methyltransferase Ada [Chloroflexota bacterium]
MTTTTDVKTLTQTADDAAGPAFIIAVRSTGIFCRPGCPARAPKPENIVLYWTTGEAEAAGFRACKRCRPLDPSPDPRAGYLAEACAYLDDDPDAEPSLASVADRLGLRSEYLRRLFRRELGVSPRQYLASARSGRLKDGLRKGATVTRALYDAGYPSGSRLYEKSDDVLGMTPATYRRGGAGITVRYEITDCALGKLLVGATERGVCIVKLGDDGAQLERKLEREFPRATLERQGEGLSGWVSEIVRYVDGETMKLDLPLDIQATAFQMRVWRALRGIARGQTKSYSQVAREIGSPRAVRAVARACATNPVGIVIPCHRVVRNDGSLGGYGGGVERKEALLAMESRPEPAGDERSPH